LAGFWAGVTGYEAETVNEFCIGQHEPPAALT
jgi:hypothetical protein